MSSRRRALIVAGAIALGLGIVVVRLWVDGRAAFRAGAQAEAAGDRARAIREYQNAARLYLPGAAYVGDGLARLFAIADAAEGEGDTDNARRALEAVRAAILGTRSFYVPHEARLLEADRRLASLYARIEDPARDPGASPEARVAWHAERLARRPGPATAPAVIALFGLALWVGAAVAFFSRALDSALRLRRPQAIAAGLVFVAGFTMFLVGLRLS